MPKQKNPKNHRSIYEKVYIHYLMDAAKRKLISKSDMNFWIDIHNRTKENPNFNLFSHMYRQNKRRIA